MSHALILNPESVNTWFPLIATAPLRPSLMTAHGTNLPRDFNALLAVDMPVRVEASRSLTNSTSV